MGQKVVIVFVEDLSAIHMSGIKIVFSFKENVETYKYSGKDLFLFYVYNGYALLF